MNEEKDDWELSKIIDEKQENKIKESFIENKKDRKEEHKEVLDLEVFKKVNACLKACMSINGTCKYIGISRSTWYLWKTKAEREGEALYVDFFKMVEQALGYAEFRLLVEIQKDKSWQAKHTILKRRFHEDWGDKQTIEVQSTIKENLANESNYKIETISDEEAMLLLETLKKMDAIGHEPEQDQDS